MIAALASFLTGSFLRTVWGELSAWFTAQQEHQHEIERMRLQGELDAAQHGRNQDAIRLQAELGVKTIQVQAEADVERIETGGWAAVVEGTTKTIGIRFIDAWNATIRPSVATWSVIMMTLGEFTIVTLSENAIAVCSAALGIYLADRTLLKRGK